MSCGSLVFAMRRASSTSVVGEVAALRPRPERDVRARAHAVQRREVLRTDDLDAAPALLGDVHEGGRRDATLEPVRGHAADVLRSAGENGRPVRVAQRRLRGGERDVGAVGAQLVQRAHLRAGHVVAHAVDDHEHDTLREHRGRRVVRRLQLRRAPIPSLGWCRPLPAAARMGSCSRPPDPTRSPRACRRRTPRRDTPRCPRRAAPMTAPSAT